MLNTPAGNPALMQRFGYHLRLDRASPRSAWTTAVQPAAIAAASLPQMKPASLFHGVMRPATPKGSIITSAVPTRRVKR